MRQFRMITSGRAAFNCLPSWSQGLFSRTHIICRLTITWLFSSLVIFLSSERIAAADDTTNIKDMIQAHAAIDGILIDILLCFACFMVCFDFCQNQNNSLNLFTFKVQSLKGFFFLNLIFKLTRQTIKGVLNTNKNQSKTERLFFVFVKR